MQEISFRSAETSDAPLVARFLRELAEYEKLTDKAHINEGQLAQHLAPGAAPQIYVIIAEHEEKPIGMAIYFMNYSTFTTSWGLRLEDLYVIEPYRSHGVGRAFFVVLARIAQKHGYSHLGFSVLDWNVSARALYERLGAVALNKWVPMRLEGDALLNLARHPELQAVQMKKSE